MVHAVANVLRTGHVLSSVWNVNPVLLRESTNECNAIQG